MSNLFKVISVLASIDMFVNKKIIGSDTMMFNTAVMPQMSNPLSNVLPFYSDLGFNFNHYFWEINKSNDGGRYSDVSDYVIP
jgi:hypothetical protein